MVNCEKIRTFLPWLLSLGSSLAMRVIFPEEPVRSSSGVGGRGGGGGATPFSAAVKAFFSWEIFSALRFFSP
jgi:hypothetical protein